MIGAVMDLLCAALHGEQVTAIPGLRVTSSDNDNDSGEIFIEVPAQEPTAGHKAGDMIQYAIRIREDEWMRAFQTAPGVSPDVAAALDSMAISGSSETIAVAECLNTIAENGDEQATDDFLLGCAEELIEAARGFIRRVRLPLPTALAAYAAEPHEMSQPSLIVTTPVEEHDRVWPEFLRCVETSGDSLWTRMAGQAFTFANEADAAQFLERYADLLPGARVKVRGR